MASLNKAILIGNLGKDPEMRNMTNGDAVANFSIATTESYKGRDGNKQDKTEWHNVVIYGKLAEIAGQYLKKGRTVYIEGRIQTRKWHDKNGQDRYTTEIIASAMQMLGGRGESTGVDCSMDDTAPAQHASTAPARRVTAPAKPVDEFEDDIPF